jgi:hydroxyacylglutathione hydrolase
MSIPLEDQFQDVIGKARRGLRLSESSLAQKAGVDLEKLESLGEGRFDEKVAGVVASALGLDKTALTELAKQSWQPSVKLPATLAAFNTPFDDMTVNAYLIWDREGGRATAFDTGADCSGILKALAKHQLTLDSIFLTHTHPDHVADIRKLRDETKATVFVSELEKVPRATLIRDGQQFTVGGLTITARLTPGHSPGGTTYVVEGINPAAAVVGDALFAGSMGGVAPEFYANALRTNREHIFSLPDSTVICPGHGPVSSVSEEKRHNPFYARNSG